MADFWRKRHCRATGSESRPAKGPKHLVQTCPVLCRKRSQEAHGLTIWPKGRLRKVGQRRAWEKLGFGEPPGGMRPNVHFSRSRGADVVTAAPEETQPIKQVGTWCKNVIDLQPRDQASPARIVSPPLPSGPSALKLDVFRSRNASSVSTAWRGNVRGRQEPTNPPETKTLKPNPTYTIAHKLITVPPVVIGKYARRSGLVYAAA